MDQTQRLDWEDEEEETPVERHRPVGNLHMFAGTHGPAQDFPIYPGPNVIGRHASCDITLPAQSVSKKHAILTVTGDCHTICDNGSLNKTRRSKVALEPEVRYSLSNGDFLLFADVACRYTIVKKIEVVTVPAEESEDDSMLVPGTQAALAIEKTPGAAIRRMGRGAVLAKDSGDEDEEVQRGWNNGGEGGSKDVLGTSESAAGATSSPAADTVVPESDEENDTSTSGTNFPSLHLRCDSDTDNHETPTKGSSFIPASQNIFTPPDVKEPAKEESNKVLQMSKEEKPVREQTDDDKSTSSVEKDVASDSGLLEEGKETREDGAEHGLPCGDELVVQTDTLDSGLKDGGTNAINNGCEEAKIETPEMSSTSNPCLKDNEVETSRKDSTVTIATESNPDHHTQAEEDNLKSTEKDLNVEANLSLDSDTDSDEDVPTTSGTDVKKKDDLEIKSDKAPEQINLDALQTSDSGVHMDRDANIDEDEDETSAVEHSRVGGINIDSDTDVEDDIDMSKTETKTGNASEVPNVDSISGTNASTGFDFDSDTDVEDADITRSDEKMVDQESGKFVEEKKDQFNFDSDTDVEDNGEVSSTKVRKGDFDSVAADVPIKESKDESHLDSYTDVEEDASVSNSDVAKREQALNVDVQEGLHVDSDTDVEDDVPSAEVTKEKQDSSNSVQDAKDCLPLDSNVDKEDQSPGTSCSAVQSDSAKGRSHINDQHLENDVVAVRKEAAHLHSSSDTDEDDKTSTGPGPKKAEEPVKTMEEKNEAEAVNEAAALHIDSDTDEDDESVNLDKSHTAESELQSDGVSEGDGGSSLKVSESSVGQGGTIEVSGADTNTVPVACSEEETQKADSQDSDYELMATQCYLEPQEPESDLPDEEEATQAYILSSTWAEPDLFKRPSDPVGVLQISAVTLDKSEEEEEEDEDAIAETQLFCLGADQSPGPRTNESPQLEEDVVDNQQESEPASGLQGSGKAAQELPLAAISQEDTEPVSQHLSTKPPDETGTWLHIKRDVPTSIWMKGLQQAEISNMEKESTQDDSTQDDLPPLELEATQSYILEASNIQEPLIQSHGKPDESAVPETEKPPRDAVNLEPLVLAVPVTESPPTAPSMPERDVSTVTSTESAPTRSGIPEEGVLAVPENISSPSASSNLEACVLAVPLTEDPPTEHGKLELGGVSPVPATETSHVETQVTDDDDATQAYGLNPPVSDVNVPQSSLDVPSPDDATQPCSLNVECTASTEAQPSGVPIIATSEEKTNLADTEKGKPSSKRGLSRSRKKEQPEKSTEISIEKAQLPEQAHSTPEETAELAASEPEQCIPNIVVSETKEEIEPQKGERKRGRRKATEEPESKTKTKEELVVSLASRKRSSKVSSEAGPSTSGINEARRKQPSRKNAVEIEDEKQDKAKEDLISEKSKDSDVSEALSENHPEKIEGLKSKDEHVIEPTSMEMSEGQMDSGLERDITSTSLKPSVDKIVSMSSKNAESDESILDLPEQSVAISTPQNQKPVRGRRRVATKAKQDNTQETESSVVEGKPESETSGTYLEKQGDFKMPTPRTSDSQDEAKEGPGGRRTRRTRGSTTQSLEKEKLIDVDTKTSQNEEANKTSPEDQNSKSIRQRRNVKEVVKEESQNEEQTGRLPSKRAISLRGDQKNKEKNSQKTLEDNPDSSSPPKRTRKYSKKELPKPEQEVTEVGKPEEEYTAKLPRRTQKGYKEEQKTEANEGRLEGPSTSEAKTPKRTRRGSKEHNSVDKEETVTETVTRKGRNSKPEDTPLEDEIKRSVRTRKVLKEEVVEETTMNTNKVDPTGQNTSRRSRRTVKADVKMVSEHTGDVQQDKELSQSVRSSSRTKRKSSTEESEKLENTGTKEELSEGPKKEDEVSIHEETPRKGRTRRTSAREELSPVSTPVASKRRGPPRQASNAEVEVKRKKSNETQEVEVKPAGRRGRPRKLSTADDSQTSVGSGRELSTPEPSPSRGSSRLRQSPAISNPPEVRTPRRTGRLSASALSASPFIPQPGAPPKVLFTGVVDATGEEIIRSLGGDIADSVFDCTHLVTDRVRRTVKFLCALARGIPIVTLDWIDKCKKSGCFLSHTKFLVKDKEQEKNFNFVLSESLQKAKRNLLFEGYEIHVTSSVKPDPELMKDIICCSGATFLPKMPRTFKEKCVIVSCSEDAARCKSVPSRIPITTAEFILSGILRQEVNPGAYLLSSEVEDSAPAPAKRRR